MPDQSSSIPSTTAAENTVPPSPTHKPRPTTHSNATLDDGTAGGLFDLAGADLNSLKSQVVLSAPFAEALKAQEEMKDVAPSVVYRAHYINKRKEGEITREHEQYNLTYAMMIGIRHSVQNWNTASRHKTLEPVAVKDMRKGILDSHFKQTYKTFFPPEGGDMDSPSPLDHTPPHLLKGGFKFKDYAPEVFARLRKRFEIDDQDYLNSLCGSFNFLEFVSNSKSGEFFFYSHDGRFMIKTQKRRECRFMLEMLPKYYAYVADNPNSMLVRICGVHRVKMPYLRRKMHFVIMMSVFSDATEARPVNRIYDLKGATVGRRAGEDETVKKDLDILEDMTKLHLGKKRKAFIDQVDKDSKFLASMGVMDYSLLVGIHGGHQQKMLLLTSTNARGRLNSQVNSFIFRSDRKSTLGLLSSSNSMQQLLQDGNASQDTLGVNSNPGGIVPSLPPNFSKHQVVRQSHDLPNIAEGAPSPKNSALHSTGSKEKLTAEIAQLRINASVDLGTQPTPPPPLAAPSSFRTSNVQGFNSFYKIDSPDLYGSSPGMTYHVGIIDIFTRYNAVKRGEHAVKSLTVKNRKGISAVAPAQYQARFVKFIASLTVDD